MPPPPGATTGRYAITLILPTGQPLLKVLRNRDVRRRLFEASVNRANSGEHDNSQVLLEIVTLRAQRARLLGFATHADAKVADQTVKIDRGDRRIPRPAGRPGRRQRRRGGGAAGRDWPSGTASSSPRGTGRTTPSGSGPRSMTSTPPRCGLISTSSGCSLTACSTAADRLYGIELVRRTDLVGYHPDVRVWEVRDADGSTIGLFLGDYFAREGKRGGAWMSNFVDQSFLLGSVPVVINVLNLPRPAAGEPALCSLDEVRTLFHEFGHALHGLFSQVTYPRLSGTDVPRDFVEYPSQVNEMWILWPEVLENYARHVETGEPLPAEVVAAIRAAEKWGEGFGTTEYLAATVLDQAWHRITADQQITDVAAFERQALADAGIAHPLVPPRYRSTYFQHIFAGGYSAGYYSYIWSEVLDAETVEWFKENGGLRRENGDLFRSRLLSVGGSVEAMDAFRSVRGRDADIGPLLKRRGLDRAWARI